MESRTKIEKLLIIISYITLYIVWGSTYFFIKISVETIPPLYVLSIRFFFGGILLLLIVFFFYKVRELPSIKELFNAILLGSLLLIGGNGLVTIAEKKIDSYLAALILSSVPLMVAVFNWILYRKKNTLLEFLGIILGIIGVGFLVYNGNSFITSFSPAIILVILALCSWSFATSLGHSLKVHKNNLVNSGMQMLWVGIATFLMMSFFKPSFFNIVASVSTRSFIAVTYLAIIGSFAFAAYAYLIKHEPAMRLVTYAFVNPIIAVFLGLVLGNEKPVKFLIIGLPLILFGLFLMIYGNKVVLLMKTTFKNDKQEK